MTAPPETHYARSGDVSIAYQVTGEGPFDVVYAPPFISNVELAWEVPEMASFYERLSSFCRLIRFDKRGQGMSDRVSGVPTLETRMDDVRAVMDAVGSQRAALIGISEGTPMSILFAATYPERVWALALCGSFARARWAPDYPMGARDEEIRFDDEETEQKWGSAEHSTAIARRLLPDASEESVAAFARLLRQSASPGSALALNRMNNEIDVRAALPLIRVPTVVIYRENEDPFITEGSRYIVEQIPAAQERVLPGSEHAPYAGATQAYTDAIRDFFIAAWEHRAGEEEEHDRVLATILFTDIVGSTAKAAELGDRRWREVLEAFADASRKALASHGGQEVKSLGDGFLATFDGPARGVRCAKAIVAATGSLGIPVRAGLHTGECEVMGEDIGGMAVHIAARVSALAQADEVLVSRTVRDLVAGSGLQFEDRGRHALKGVPDEWDLLAVAG
jgi:class 3 adenylate cyclase/pimeloyl-ACP methyl ester carboxylesterase